MFLKVKQFSVLFLIYSFLLIFSYWVYVNFFQVNVVLFSSILSVFFAVIPISIYLFIFPFDTFNIFEKILILTIFILYGYAIAISLPTVIDRSLSFYLLEKIYQRGGGIEKNAFERIFKNEYVLEHRLMDIRITEQLESGTVIIEDNCVLLTNKGQNIVHFSQFFRRNFLPNSRLIMGVYTADLVDPLKQSNKNKFDDECKAK